MTNEETIGHFRVHGRVQGVGFRWWTRQQAHALGLRGSVRNRPDGTVEVRAVGPSDAIRRLRALLAEGPPSAAVQEVEERPPSSDDLPADGFTILR